MIEREGRIKISAQTTGKEQIAGMSKALGDMDGAANRASEGFLKMGSAVSGLSFAAWNQGLQLGIQLLSDAYRSLDEYSNLSMQFKGNIHELTAAVEHEIGAIDLMRGQNRLLLADIKITDKQYADLAIAINKIAEATGRDGAQALETFTASIERNSERGLKQLGIVVDLRSAQEEYARELGKGVKDLSDIERAQALFNVSLEATQDKAKAAGDQVETYTDRSAKGLNKIKDKLLEVMDLINRGREDEAVAALWRGYVSVTNKVWNDMSDAVGEARGITRDAFHEIDPATVKMSRLRRGRDELENNTYSEYTREYVQEMERQLDRGGVDVVPLTGEGADQYGSGETLYQRYGANTVLHRDEKAAEARAEAKKGGQRRGAGGRKREPETQAWEMQLQNMAAEDAFWQKEYDEQQAREKKAAEMNDKADAQWRVDQLKQDQAFDQQMEKLRKQEKAVRDENTKLAKSLGVDVGQAAKFAGGDIIKLNDNLTRLSERIKQADADMQNIAEGGLHAMAEGVVMSVDAALSGADSFGSAMAKITQSVLRSMAIEYGVKAVLAAGEALWHAAMGDAAGAAAMFGAAAKFAAGAAAAGAGSVIAGAGVSGDSTQPQSSVRETAARGSTASTGGASWGKKEETKQPIVVNLYLGDKGDPAAALYLRKQLDAQIKQAA